MSISNRSPLLLPRQERFAGLPAKLPRLARGMRIGLFGGTFNPPHDGHRLASLIAKKRMELSAVWWIVTPGNPLKENSGLPPMLRRMEAARAIADHPDINVTGFEADIGTPYTYETIHYLVKRHPDVHFVWIMGADNLTGFHRWQRWQDITRLVPICVIDRPASTLRGASSRVAHRLAGHRVAEKDAPLLPYAQAPAFMFLHGPRSDLSSTELRAKGKGLV
ncbi:MAG: nicotinate-nucleotide adenylyltransferase [Beijerinckiaceae bacterium]